MRNDIICAGLVLLETVLLVCGSGEESYSPLSGRETDEGYNLHERLGIKDYRVLKYRIHRKPCLLVKAQLGHLYLSDGNQTCRAAQAGPPESVPTLILPFK